MTDQGTIQDIPFTCTLDCGSRCELVARVRVADKGGGADPAHQSGAHAGGTRTHSGGTLAHSGGTRIDTPTGRPDTVERPRLIPCARGRAQGRARTAPDRLLYPQRRAGPRGSGRFARITWDEALDEIAERLREIQAHHGPQALLHATGAGSVSGRGFSGADASRRFFAHWGPVTATSGNMSNHNVSVAADWMLGGRLPGSDRATLLDARLILLWGMNPAETHMGPNTAHFIAQARDRGARVIVIDPRYTDTCILADQWIPIRPGSDAALVAAMAYVLESEGLVDRAFMASHTAGYAAYRRYLLGEEDAMPKTPAWAEPLTGIPAATIHELARDYALSRPAALLPGWGPQRTLYGEQISRALIVLACLSGNVGLRGGGLASVGTRLNSSPGGHLPGGPHTHRNGAARRVSAVMWAREVLQGRLSPPLRAAYIVASNLINRSPDTRANARALAQLDWVIVHEPFMTPTARYADLALPICTDLERSDLVTSWGHDQHLFYSRQALAPAGEARTDYWVFARLAERLGFGAAYTENRSEEQWIERFLDARRLDVEGLERAGIMRQDGEPRVALAEFRADPLAHPLPTPSGRIEISNPQAEEVGLPAIPSFVEAGDGDGEHPLQLITPHYKFRSNSCLDAVPWLQRLEPHAVWINPLDARARDIADRDTVEVYNRRGTIRLPAKVTARIMPGVVCVYQGAWYRPGPDGVDEGGCANVLTEHRESPTGGCATHSTWVEVRPSAAEVKSPRRNRA
jgi:anaerobic dimethyl sulfoxide reductase subunit A